MLTLVSLLADLFLKNTSMLDLRFSKFPQIHKAERLYRSIIDRARWWEKTWDKSIDPNKGYANGERIVASNFACFPLLV